MKPIEFVVPIRTVSEANSRSHWAAKAKRVKSQRQAVTLASMAAGIPTCKCKCRQWVAAQEHWQVKPLRPLWVTLTRIAPSALDTDNLASSFKATRDEVALMLGIDDRSSDVAWAYAQRKGKPREYAVEVKIVEAANCDVKPVEVAL